MSDLSHTDLEDLLADAILADRNATGTPIAPRLRVLLQEQRRLREEAGERERLAAQEVGW